jgi:hypothetical protein
LSSCAAAVPPLVAHPSFTAQYIRTDGYHSEIQYPVITIIKDKSELSSYNEKNKTRYSLDRRPGSITSDSTTGFLDAADTVDEAFFENNFLILVLVQESSGSNRHLVKDIIQEEQKTRNLIERQVPSIGTADMAQWHIFIALTKKDFRDQPISVEFL